MTAGDYVEATIFAIGGVDCCPGADGCCGFEPFAKVKFVLVPGESQSDFGCFPEEEVVDAQNVWAEYVEEWIGQAWIAHAGEEFRDVATGVMDFVHGVDTQLLVFAVSDEGISVDVSHWHFSFPGDNVFGDLPQVIVFFM